MKMLTSTLRVKEIPRKVKAVITMILCMLGVLVSMGLKPELCSLV